MTAGQFDTSIVALEFYDQQFRQGESGLSAALAVLLFVIVIPVIVYNVRQMRISEEVRSEEHTSELQSLMRISYAVFCLKQKNTNHLYDRLNCQHFTRSN